MNLKKTIVITGGSRGVGHALVKTFHQEGWRVAALARHPAANFPTGDDFLFFEANVTQADAIENVADEIVRKWGRVDAWINNAGVGKLIPFVGPNELEWAEIFNVNFWGTINGCRAAVRAMLNDGQGGSIINIASLAGIQACPTHSAYSTAKAAVIALTRSLAVEYAARGVRVNAIAPGPLDTEGFRAAGGDPVKRAASIPTRKMVTPQEIVEACLFLAKPMASLTGQTLAIDGGSAAAGCYVGFEPR